MTSMYSLPQEIINLIVDAIGARNKVDLCRLALTSRVFLSQAQSQLYRSIKLELSYCIRQISKDLDAFHTILLQSQNIKFIFGKSLSTAWFSPMSCTTETASGAVHTMAGFRSSIYRPPSVRNNSILPILHVSSPLSLCFPV